MGGGRHCAHVFEGGGGGTGADFSASTLPSGPKVNLMHSPVPPPGSALALPRAPGRLSGPSKTV